MEYREAVQFLLSLPDMERKASGAGARVMSMNAMHALLARLGNPQLAARTVHVTGSKGKGSTSTFLASILESAGLNTALYTSPHLHSFNERICFGLSPVTEEDFAGGTTDLQAAISEIHTSDLGPISTFGAMTALFFHLVREHEIRWQVVEVGMGGTNDATNVFPDKDVAVFTPISLEHTRVLGSTTGEIARSKSGIITPGCSTILARQSDGPARDIIQSKSRESGGRLVDCGLQYRCLSSQPGRYGQEFVLDSPYGPRKFHISMLGEHQIINAATAVAVADALCDRGEKITEESIREGLSRVSLPGRLEVLADQPTIVLDGAHNRDSTRAMINALARHFEFDKCIAILGVNADKDIHGIVEELRAGCDILIATRSASEKALPVPAVMEAASRIRLPVREAVGIEEALEMARGEAGARSLVVVTGSLYLVAEAREAILGQRPYWSPFVGRHSSLKHRRSAPAFGKSCSG